MDGTLASPVDLKDLCGFPLNPKDLLCFQQTSSTILKIAQILCIQRTTFGSEDGPRPVDARLRVMMVRRYK